MIKAPPRYSRKILQETEILRLKKALLTVEKTFSSFGVNKKQETLRLLYEISKRENISPLKIVKKAPCDYDGLKRYLVKRRYPSACLEKTAIKPYLPKIELHPSDAASLTEKKFYPKKVFVEDSARDSWLARRFKLLFPRADFIGMSSLKDCVGSRGGFSIEDYNARRDTVFIVNEKYDFFKRCPCTRSAVTCGYNIFNLGFGCIFECVYCYLQGYANNRGIILPANLEDFFGKFPPIREGNMRVGTGEFSDSLALDAITEYSIPIVEFFRKKRNVVFEFKTKSCVIDNLLKTEHKGNIAVSWSLNPQEIIAENEFFTPPLIERLKAARKCADAGYKIGFHLDPVIYSNGWRKRYQLLIEALFDKISPRRIAWISVGTLRFAPSLKTVIERRFAGNRILEEELLPGYDNKLRYRPSVRQDIYKEMLRSIFKHSRRLNVYLCMEDALMWKELKLRKPRFA